MTTQEYRQKFLIVDDDISLRTVLNIALEAKGNVEVVEASDGAEALKLIDELDLSAVILDLLMPNMTGVELLNTLNGRSNIPKIIVMTALEEALADQPSADQPLAEQLRQLGAAQVLKKPFHISEFFSAVDEMMAVPA